MRRPTFRRLSSTLALTALIGLLAPTAVVADEPDTTPTDDPVEAAAGWLATQLVDGERMESTFGDDTFVDQGLTADVVLALAGAGVADDQIQAATDWLEGQAEAYTSPGDDVYAGPTAKLALTLMATDRDTTVDGLDLIAQLEDREQDTGRYTDDSEWGDFSSVISQSLALLALQRADGTSPSEDAVDYLLDQQCDDGGFPQALTDPQEPVTGDGAAFSDLSDDNVHAEAVRELAQRGVLLGHPDGTLRPANDLTRGQLASVLARAGDIEPIEGERFSDVAGSPHEGAIYALAEEGVINGYADGTYRPQQPIQRDHVAALIARWLELSGVDEDHFDDLDTTIHRELINALAELDIARGDGQGSFNPHREVRRDQASSFVLRAIHVLEEREAPACDSQIDATGFAAQALDALGETAAVDAAGAWLADVQQDDGGFVGSEGTANANSTGLAAVALDVAGLDDEAESAREFLRSLQDGCDGTEPGSIRYDTSDTPQVERPRATAQALPGLTGTSFADVDATDASDEVPELDCDDGA